MNLDEEFKKLKERGMDNPLPLQKMARILAASLDRAAIQWGFKTYWNKNFLRLAEINSIDQTEKDRIFNELILAGETLIMLTLEARDLRSEEEFKVYLLSVKDEVPNAHDDYMKEIGIERKYRKLWKKLIEMRYEEYSESKLTAREAMMEYEGKEKALETSDLEGITLTLPPFTIAVGCHKHVVRGKNKGKDPLFKLIMKRLGRFYVEIRIMIEGGKISPILKARMKLRHFWKDLKEDLSGN